MTKEKLLLIITVIICFSCAGCGQKGVASANKNLSTSNSVTQSKLGSSSNGIIDKEQTAAANDEFEDLSNSLDEIEATLNSIDDTQDINETDSLINNLN